MAILALWKDLLACGSDTSTLSNSIDELVDQSLINTDNELLLLKNDNLKLKSGKTVSIEHFKESVVQLKYISARPRSALDLLNANQAPKTLTEQFSWPELAQAYCDLKISHNGNPPAGDCWEISGPPGAGKTQIALGTAANYLAANPCAKAIWIDTSNGFSATRFSSFCKPSESTSVLARLEIHSIYSLDELLKLLQVIASTSQTSDNPKVGLLVIDSITPLISVTQTFIPQVEPVSRALTQSFWWQLQFIANRFQASVVIVNHSTAASFQRLPESSQLGEQRYEAKPALGQLWDLVGSRKTTIWIDFQDSSATPVRQISLFKRSHKVT